MNPKDTRNRLPLQEFKHFRTYQGLPPDGEPGIFLGWDKDHQPWTLVWDHQKECWGAVGWERDNESVQPDRAIYKALKEQWADFIVQWAFSPVCPPLKVWPDEAAPIRQDSWQTLQDWRDTFVNDLYKKKGSLIATTTKRGT